MSTLRTDFSGAFDSGLFAKTETFGTVTQTGGEMIFTGSGGGGICYVTDQTAVDISGGENFYIKMSGTTPAYPCRMWLAVLDNAGVGWGFRFGGTGVNLFQIGTFSSGLGSWSAGSNFGDFDIAVHVYMRLRYAGGTIYWDYSTDGSSWTNRANQAVPGGMVLTAVKATFGQVESDSSDVYKVTDYFAPALAGGGGSSFAQREPAVFGLRQRLEEIEEDDRIRRNLGSFMLSGVVFLSAPLRPILKVFGMARRREQEDELDTIRRQIAFKRIKPSVLSTPPTASPKYTFARIFGLQSRQALEETIDLERSRRAFSLRKPRTFPTNLNTTPRFQKAQVFGLAMRQEQDEYDARSRATSYFRRTEAVAPITPPSTTPKNNIFWWLRRYRR